MRLAGFIDRRFWQEDTGKLREGIDASAAKNDGRGGEADLYQRGRVSVRWKLPAAPEGQTRRSGRARVRRKSAPGRTTHVLSRHRRLQAPAVARLDALDPKDLRRRRQ